MKLDELIDAVKKCRRIQYREKVTRIGGRSFDHITSGYVLRKSRGKKLVVFPQNWFNDDYTVKQAAGQSMPLCRCSGRRHRTS